ncbi:MAG: hypothetical protein LBD75_04340 [Candidatus Peribacteria bacterium]|nr:hypothetical protein [Candidatus Peribacteria bacterium]
MVLEACVAFSVFSFAADLYIPSCTTEAQYTTDTCHSLNVGLQLLPDTNPHCFTCDVVSRESTTCDDRSIAKRQGGNCSYRGNNYSCQRCECPSGMIWKSENGGRATCKCSSGRAVQDGNSRKCEACQ